MVKKRKKVQFTHTPFCSLSHFLSARIKRHMDSNLMIWQATEPPTRPFETGANLKLIPTKSAKENLNDCMFFFFKSTCIRSWFIQMNRWWRTTQTSNEHRGNMKEIFGIYMFHVENLLHFYFSFFFFFAQIENAWKSSSLLQYSLY